ncbi:MAG: L-carnitine dehydratase/bile acid-inducible protein [Acidimicrobiia bacterium]|nr:L-carnitine dehydratase/bile acid-inducible protein [Acidimicrobiia bacterium]
MTATGEREVGKGEGPLAHVKVLDLSRMYPGAFCTLLLADLGADVLKVEGPGGGDGLRPMAGPGQFNPSHTALNRGKRSLVLDLRNPGAAAVLKRLVRWADVVIESHKPKQLDDLGLGYAVMSVENPRVVWCSLTGFGDFGPNAAAAGHDITYLGYSGLLGRLADGPTTPPAAPISLPLTGLMGAVGILAALSNANRTGEGTRLDVNMVDASMWTLSEDFARAASAPGPGWGTMAARNVYTCADGREVTVASNEPRTWAKLCEALAVPELAGHRIGVDPDEPATARLAEVFATKPAAEWLANPGLGGGVGPVFDAPDLLVDPQVTERGSLVPLAGSGAGVLANPIRFHSELGSEASYGLSDAPALGADTLDALTAAGFSADEIGSLQADKVVGG